MQTSRFLHKILTTSASVLHRARFNALATCVQALLGGQSLTLTSLGRQLPRQIQPKHAIKCVDRVLGNPHLQQERLLLYANLLEQAPLGYQPQSAQVDLVWGSSRAPKCRDRPRPRRRKASRWWRRAPGRPHR